VAKKRGKNYPKAFRKLAVDRLKSCDNVSALSKELGVDRCLLYKWRNQIEPIDKTLEADFFKGALQKVEARRQSNTRPGETASTTKSGS